jgi:hypothetical protein
MSLIPTPDYRFAERWPARIAMALLTVPFLAAAYGLGCAVDWLLPDTDFDGYGGVVSTLMFVAMLACLWTGQWFKGFRT